MNKSKLNIANVTWCGDWIEWVTHHANVRKPASTWHHKRNVIVENKWFYHYTPKRILHILLVCLSDKAVSILNFGSVRFQA